MEVAPGIHRIRGPFFKNIYLVVDGSPLLIDTGLPGSCSVILSSLRVLGIGRRELEAVVLTHSHVDHMGSARSIAKATGAQIWAHHLDAPNIEGIVPPAGYRSHLEGVTHGLSRICRTRVDRRLSEGDMIDCLGGLEVLHTPGHTEGSICLYQRERGILFSGDAIQYNWGRVRSPMAVFCHDKNQVRESIERVSRLDFQCMLPGEGRPLVANASERVRQFVQRTRPG
jgi:glyoxylase-like metal-dependent hydrolase (beta-lactamase superfamily II)